MWEFGCMGKYILFLCAVLFALYSYCSAMSGHFFEDGSLKAGLVKVLSNYIQPKCTQKVLLYDVHYFNNLGMDFIKVISTKENKTFVVQKYSDKWEIEEGDSYFPKYNSLDSLASVIGVGTVKICQIKESLK